MQKSVLTPSEKEESSLVKGKTRNNYTRCALLPPRSRARTLSPTKEAPNSQHSTAHGLS